MYLLETIRINALIRNYDNILTNYFEIKKTFEFFYRKYY